MGSGTKRKSGEKMLGEEINDTCPPSKLKNVFSGELLSSFSEFRDDGVRISQSFMSLHFLFSMSKEGRLSSVPPGADAHYKMLHIQHMNHAFLRVNSPKLQVIFSHLPSALLFFFLKFEVSTDVNTNITVLSTVKGDLVFCLYHCQHHKLQDLSFPLKQASQNFH